MDTITLTKKEYKELLEAKKRLYGKVKLFVPAKKKSKFLDEAFGIFKDDFGKTSSIAYVSKMRKLWRS